MPKKKTVKKRVASAKKTPSDTTKKINKSQAIRDYRAKHPSAGPTKVSEALSKEGIKVTPSHVSNVLSSSKMSNGVGRKGTRKRKGDGVVRVSDLIAAQKFADQVGGVQSARTLLGTIEMLGR